MSRAIIVPLAAGALLTFGCAGRQGEAATPAEGPEPEVAEVAEPEVPAPEVAAPGVALPTWEALVEQEGVGPGKQEFKVGMRIPMLLINRQGKTYFITQKTPIKIPVGWKRVKYVSEQAYLVQDCEDGRCGVEVQPPVFSESGVQQAKLLEVQREAYRLEKARPESELPTWDGLARGSMEMVQRTNPPIPTLVVEPDGTCHFGSTSARGHTSMDPLEAASAAPVGASRLVSEFQAPGWAPPVALGTQCEDQSCGPRIQPPEWALPLVQALKELK